MCFFIEVEKVSTSILKSKCAAKENKIRNFINGELEFSSN